MGGTALKRWKIIVHPTLFHESWEFDIVAANGAEIATSTRCYSTARGAVRAAQALVAADFDLDDIKVVKS